MIHTKYKKPLKHVKIRAEYTYCPYCDKTTKDYGGKKHTYHQYGTLISDVWRDIACELDGDLLPVISRFQDLFSLEPYQKIMVLDCRFMRDISVSSEIVRESSCQYPLFAVNKSEKISENSLPPNLTDRLINGDCLERLKELPDNSIDFIFTDPPYNLDKKYNNYSDDLEIKEYFDWCDKWIAELVRVLKPGRTLALLNIPIWSVRFKIGSCGMLYIFRFE